MMKIKIVAVGKIKEQYYKEMINEYTKRLSKYCRVEIEECLDESIPKNSSAAIENVVKEKEGIKLLNKIRDNEYVILLDLHGNDKYDSITFARYFDKLMTDGNSVITFVIGGSLGLSEDVKNRANKRISLSKFTFTHQMTRIILLEQIYRSFKILNNETYHK